MEEKREKVYCGNCKHYTSGLSDRFYEYCEAEDDKEEIDVHCHVRPKRERPRIGPERLNKYNNCRWYEKNEWFSKKGDRGV